MSRSLIKAFFTDKIEVSDAAPGKFVKGRYKEGDSTTRKLVASVQPLTPREIQLLPEGRRERWSLKVFTRDPLFVNDTLAKTAASVITYKSKKFEVHQVNDWSCRTDLPHYESVIILIDPNGSEESED